MIDLLAYADKTPRQRARDLARPVKPPRVTMARERAIHIEIMDNLHRWQKRDWRWTCFPAGEFRTAETGGLLKRMGLAPGWADIQGVAPSSIYHGLEVKAEDGKLSDAQEAMQAWAQEQGVHYAVVYSAAEAMQVVAEWGGLRIDLARVG